jgi:hypothetical protein
MAIVDHPWWLFALLLIVLAGVVEVGFRLSSQATPGVDRERHEQIAGTRNDIAILLSLLLGFTLAALKRSKQVQTDLWQQSIAVARQSEPLPFGSIT